MDKIIVPKNLTDLLRYETGQHTCMSDKINVLHIVPLALFNGSYNTKEIIRTMISDINKQRFDQISSSGELYLPDSNRLPIPKSFNIDKIRCMKDDGWFMGYTEFEDQIRSQPDYWNLHLGLGGIGAPFVEFYVHRDSRVRCPELRIFYTKLLGVEPEMRNTKKILQQFVDQSYHDCLIREILGRSRMEVATKFSDL